MASLLVGHAAWLWAVPALAALALGAGRLYWRQRRRGAALAAALEELTTQLDGGEAGAVPGLKSRRHFDRALDEAVARSDDGAGGLCLLFIDIDNFGLVNDSHGYAAGDEVIRQIAQRLLQAAGPGAVATRLGGDEFLLLLVGELDVARELEGRVVDEIGRPLDAPGRGDVLLTCSIGIAAYPQHGSRLRLLGNASNAMRTVKLAGGGDYMVFEPRMAVDTRDHAELSHDLRLAVARGELELYYQPKVDAHGLQITAAEALLRWHHPTRGMISPTLFVPIAERYGLIGPIGDWVIEDACRQAGIWRRSGLRMRVAINVSAHQMRQHDLVDRLEAALRKNHLQPDRFTCEITESVAMEDTRVTQHTFERMRQAGLHVSIDDFGVGQASLSYLRRLPAAELKIDASFVRDIDTSADARAIVDAVVRLAHALELHVVAEGVETAAQRDFLVNTGCDELQGYLFAKPMSAPALTLWAMNDDAAPSVDFRASLFQDTVTEPG